MLTIAPQAYRELLEHARRVHPEECCGILLGCRDGATHHVHHVQQARNIADGDRTRSFQIDWSSLLDAARGTGPSDEGMIGFYHSHPDRSVRPSRRDSALAWPGYSYVIVVVDRDEYRSITSWRRETPNTQLVAQRTALAGDGAFLHVCPDLCDPTYARPLRFHR